jgi:hypothetical protein
MVICRLRFQGRRQAPARSDRCAGDDPRRQLVAHGYLADGTSVTKNEIAPKIIERASKAAIAVFRLKLNWNAKPTSMQAATASKCGCPGESQGNRCGTDSAEMRYQPRSIHRRRGRFAASSRCRAASWLFPPARSHRPPKELLSRLRLSLEHANHA